MIPASSLRELAREAEREQRRDEEEKRERFIDRVREQEDFGKTEEGKL